MRITASNKIVIPTYQTAFSSVLANSKGYMSYNLGYTTPQTAPWPFWVVNGVANDLQAEIQNNNIAMISLGGDFSINKGVDPRGKALELSFVGATTTGGEVLDYKIWLAKPASLKGYDQILEVEIFKFCDGTATLPATPPHDCGVIGEYAIGLNNAGSGNISAYACSITMNVSSQGLFLENQYGSLGADVWSPGGSNVAKIVIPECFGSALALIEVQPNAGTPITIDSDNPVLLYTSVEY